MFDKASTLTNDKTQIWQVSTAAKDSKAVFMVKSKTTSFPHRVELCRKFGRVICDKACAGIPATFLKI
jgi:hypothetical protein